jgi:hypothetical protein
VHFLVLVLAALASASPYIFARRDNAEVAAPIGFAIIRADGCDIGQCGGVIAAAGCITLGIRHSSAAVECVSGGTTAVSYYFYTYISHI